MHTLASSCWFDRAFRRMGHVLTALVCAVATVAGLALPAPGGAAEIAGVLPPAGVLQAMEGEWTVHQWMRAGPGARLVELPPAVAHRVLVDQAFIQETMTASTGPSFTRIAFVLFNAASEQYEYASVDSRLPQLMAYALPGANRREGATLHFTGSTFVAPAWGERKNVPFLFRFELGPVTDGQQRARLYLKELGVGSGAGPEFIAFEYLYSRRR